MAADCSFSFGPNRSYVVRVNDAFAYSDEPSAPASMEAMRILMDVDETQQASAMLYDLGLAMEDGMYTMCWRTMGGEVKYDDTHLGDAYSRLARFMERVCAGGAITARTTFGPGASYFSSASGGFSWQNLPGALEEGITACMRTRHPTAVALGVEGTYVVVYSDGALAYDLGGAYPLLEALIKDARSKGGVKYVALNPFVAGEYYAVCGDGTARWNIPAAWVEEVTWVSKQIAPVDGAVVSGGTTPAPPVVEPAQPPAQQPAQPPAVQRAPAPAQPHSQPPPAEAPHNEGHGHKHKIDWKAGLEKGLKGAAKAAKVFNALEAQNRRVQQQHAQQRPTGYQYQHPQQHRPNPNGWNYQYQQQQPFFVAPPMFEEVVVQDTVYNNGMQTTFVETETVFY